MNPANLLTIGIFALAVLLGAAWLLWDDWQRKRRPSARIRERIVETRKGASMLHHEALEQLERARLLAQRRRTRARLGPRLASMLTRMNTLGGRPVWIRVGLGAALGALVGVAMVQYFNWHDLIEIQALLLCMGGGALWALTQSIRSFRKEFLKQLPDAIDMVRRASRAGVPPIQALRAVGEDLPAPLGPEFRAIGDALFLGDNMDDVLNDASARIRIPEFSFFAVFLKTQRATGGPMSETLENLAEVLRNRAQLDLKVRALTSEGRAMSWTMAVLPFAVFALLFVVNREYASLLLTTEIGRSLLVTALIMLAVGLFIIQRLARLED